MAFLFPFPRLPNESCALYILLTGMNAVWYDYTLQKFVDFTGHGVSDAKNKVYAAPVR